MRDRAPGTQSAVNAALVIASFITAGGLSSIAQAHYPDHANRPVHPRVRHPSTIVDRLPSYRDRYNRPTNVGGHLAYLISPTSQEAMSWHRSAHRGYYANHAPRMEDRYHYLKPWEALQVGGRTPVPGSTTQRSGPPELVTPPNRAASDRPNDLPTPAEPAVQSLPVPEPEAISPEPIGSESNTPELLGPEAY